jgi:hypothetical protein
VEERYGGDINEIYLWSLRRKRDEDVEVERRSESTSYLTMLALGEYALRRHWNISVTGGGYRKVAKWRVVVICTSRRICLIIRIITSRRTRMAGYVAYMETRSG